MRTNIILTFVTLAVMCVLGNILSVKIKTSVPTYTLECPAGTVLKGRKDWTDQQVEGTAFVGFTCCPVDYPDLQYLNENYFCCPSGSGAICMSNACDCKSGGALKGGKLPTTKRIAS